MDSTRPTFRLPRTLLEAVRYFGDEQICRDFMVELRWPNGVACPTCGRTDVRFISTRKLWECKDKHPRRQFSIKVGTIFEDSPLGMENAQESPGSENPRHGWNGQNRRYGCLAAQG